MLNILKNKHDVLLPIVFIILFLSVSNIFLPNLPPGAGLSLFVNNIVWLISIVFVYLAILSTVSKGLWLKPENFIVHLSLVFALVIPFLWSDDTTGRGFYRMLSAVFGIIFFICLFTSFSKNKIWILVLGISLSGLIQAFFGIIQLWLIPDLTIPQGLPLGVFLQPNVMSSYIVTTFVISLMLISICPVPYKKTGKWVCNSVNLFALLVGIIIISLNSGTAYLALAISLPLMLLAHWEKPKQVLIAILVMLVGCLLGAVINSGLDTSVNTSVGGSIDFINFPLGNTFDSGGREDIWLISWEMFKGNWLTGVGYGNFELSFLEYQANYYQQHGVYAFAKLNHPHNELILWTVEGGVLPGVAFVAYTIYTIWRMFKMGKPALPYAAILITLVAHALLEYPFYHSAIHWILFVTLLFLFEIQVGNVLYVRFKYKMVINYVALAISLAAMLFLLTNMHAIYILTKYNETEFSKRNVKTLSSIINHFTVQPHLDYFMMNGFLRKGIVEKNESLIKQSILLSEKLHANHPRPEYYKSMLVGYKALGDTETFKVKLEEARYYYPLDGYFLEVEEQYKRIL